MSRRAHCSLQKYRTPPASARRTARDFTMYVWHTGSLTSSSPSSRRAVGAGSRNRRTSGSSSTKATTRNSRNGRSRIDSTIGLDRHRPEELFVLRRQLGRDRHALLAAGEEDPGIGAAAENLLHGVSRRVGGGQRGLDRLQKLLQERVDLPVPSHRDTTISYGGERGLDPPVVGGALHARQAHPARRFVAAPRWSGGRVPRARRRGDRRRAAVRGAGSGALDPSVSPPSARGVVGAPGRRGAARRGSAGGGPARAA